MSSKRRIRRNGCTGKVAHHKHGDAVAVLAQMRRRGRGEHMNVYRCQIRVEGQARHYHIGHEVRADRALV